MKKILSLLLIISILITIPIAVNAKSDISILTNKNYKYVYVDSGVRILEYIGKSKKVTVPAEIDGKKVVKIGLDNYDPPYRKKLGLSGDENGGFSRNFKIEEVTIPKSIELSMGAFKYCTNLKKVVIKSGIKYINRDTFKYCEKLKEVSIPNTVKEIFEWAFRNCKNLKKIKLPSSLEFIYGMAFRNSGIRKVKLGKKFKEFEPSAFYKSKIKRIVVSKKNKKFSSQKGVLYNKQKTKLLYYPPNKSKKTFSILNKVKKISEEAFCDNRRIKSVIISGNVSKIDYCSFLGCSNLRKLTIKSKKKLSIDESAFYCCKKLKSVTLPRSVKKIGKYAFGYKTKKYYNEYKRVRMKGFTIKGYKGTAAEKYAKKNKFKFVALG